MFTGIVQGKAKVINIIDHAQDQFRTLSIKFPSNTLDAITTGASIAINGTCLTVRKFEADVAEFDVIAESLDKTNLGELIKGSKVNFERAARIGDEIGGHLMSGHILETIEIIERHDSEANTELVFSLTEQASEYMLEKGFAGLNGCSLTLGNVQADRFSVYLIPETLEVTTFGELQVGDKVNLEVDPQTQAIVETVKKLNLRPA